MFRHQVVPTLARPSSISPGDPGRLGLVRRGRRLRRRGGAALPRGAGGRRAV